MIRLSCVLLALFVVASQAAAAPSAIRVRLWSQHPPQQIHLAANSTAQYRICGTCSFKPLGELDVAARGNRVRLLGSSFSDVLVRGSFDVAVGATTVHLSWPMEIQASAGRFALTVIMPLEDYVAAAVAGEASGIHAPEALKAMAVAARTYAVHFRPRHGDRGFDFCDTTHCQDLRISAVSAAARAAAAATEGELVWFRGATAATYYHRSCGGTLEAAEALQPAHSPALPYLQARQDSYCVRRGPDEWRGEMRESDLRAALEAAGFRLPVRINAISVHSRTPGGRARTVRVAGSNAIDIPASRFRLAVGRALGWDLIRSDAYEITENGDTLVFFGRGQGHGVGLCQAGARVMAEEGHSYLDILSYYFPGTQVGINAQGLRWTALADEHLELLTTRLDVDRFLLPIAARELHAAEQRIGWQMDVRPQLRVFPSVAAFRDATGEPGWVAASTRGHTIRLQPTEVLQRSGALQPTLRHEYFHLLVEAKAKPGLPLWFREGLVLWLSDSRNTGQGAAGAEDLESRLRHPSSQQELRRAYAEARARVARLVARYGEQPVLQWVTTGLPTDLPVVARHATSR